MSARKYTNELIELADNGAVSWESIARAALCFMSESEVEELARCEGFIEEEEEDEEGEEE